MRTRTIILEIYEGDPFAGSCCGPNPTAPGALNDFRKMLSERSEIVKQLQKKCGAALQIQREIISARRRDYPDYVRPLIAGNEPLPYIFINQMPVTIGSFPTYAEFLSLIESPMK